MQRLLRLWEEVRGRGGAGVPSIYIHTCSHFFLSLRTTEVFKCGRLLWTLSQNHLINCYVFSITLIIVGLIECLQTCTMTTHYVCTVNTFLFHFISLLLQAGIFLSGESHCMHSCAGFIPAHTISVQHSSRRSTRVLPSLIFKST